MEIGGVGVLGHEVVEEYRGDEGSLGYAHPRPTDAGASRLELAASLSPDPMSKAATNRIWLLLRSDWRMR